MFSNLKNDAFTLVELAIALVIIGLFAGGIMVGNDLIKAAEIRSQIQQIEKYNVAVNTFKGKYGYLPGDIPDPTASAFGFVARGTWTAQGDGNGIIEARTGGSPGDYNGTYAARGETGMFWVDLSSAKLIDKFFNAASIQNTVTGAPFTDSDSISLYFPKASIGNSGYFVVWSQSGMNWFGVSGISLIGSSGFINTNSSFTVNQAYAIDTKIDDGTPVSGKVIAVRDNGVQILWSNPPYTTPMSFTPNNVAGDDTTCFDSSSGTKQYSVGINGGSGVNCALSFKFQ